MNGAGAALILCSLGAVLMRRDLRGLLRRATWRRTVATIQAEPGPSWRIAFTLPDGAPFSVVTRDLRLVARREGDGPVMVLHDPRAPARVDLPARPGLGLAVGVGLVLLGLVALLR